jgi:GNAT superfamily N-acetyltransferase
VPSSPSYDVRDGTIDDLPLIRETLYRALAWHPDRVLPPLAHTMVHPEVARYHRAWGRTGDIAVVAMSGAEPVGAAFCRVFTDDDHGHGYVDSSTPELAIALAREHRGKGAGSQLLAALEGRARSAGYRQLSLSVDAANPARRLYERCGYRTLSEDSEGIRMLKTL